jgi:hypothetical protein
MMGFFSSIDYFFSSNVLRSISISVLFLGAGIAGLFAPRFLHLKPGETQYDASVWSSLVAICFGIGFMLLDAIYTHSKVVYLSMIRDSLRERLVEGGPAAHLA